MEKEGNVEKADSNKNQPEEKGSLDGKISDDDSDSDFSPTKISHVTGDSIIDKNNDDIEGVPSSLNDLSIQSSGNLDLTSLVQSSDEPENPTVQHNILPTVNSKIIYHNPDSKSWNEGRAGKSNGKNKTWFNLKDLTNNKHLSVDFSQIKGWKNTEEEVLIVDSHDNIKILQVKETESKNWIIHVYEEVEDSGQKVISVRWVITQKFKDNEIRYKAHLVVRGFEEENLKTIRKDSPTCCRDNFCLLTGIIASKQWKIHSVDVKSTFL